jgi:probable phosphoglycerate mutase
MTTLLLIRHGENNLVGKRLAGRLPNVHLNDKGRKQAEQLAQALSQAPIKAIYSSPLERAVETAEPLARTLNLPINIAPGLVELAYGDWQGKTLKQLGRYRLWKVVQEKPSEMRFPQGESFIEVQQRAVGEAERIAAAHEEGDLVACFSHGDIIRLLIAHFLGMPLDLFQRVSSNPASITVVHIDKKGRLHLVHMNQVLAFEFKQEKADPAGGKMEADGKPGEAAQQEIREAAQAVAGKPERFVPPHQEALEVAPAVSVEAQQEVASAVSAAAESSGGQPAIPEQARNSEAAE